MCTWKWFTIPKGWERGRAQNKFLRQFSDGRHTGSVSWAPSAPGVGEVTGETTVVDDLSPKGLRSQADEIKDRIVLIGMEHAFAERFNKNYLPRSASHEFFRRLGRACSGAERYCSQSSCG